MLRPVVSLCLFVSFSAADAAASQSALRDVRLGEAVRLHIPSAVHDPFLREAPPPALMVQVYFPDLDALHAQLGILEKVLGHDASCEAMAVRRFPVPQPAVGRCSYLVRYAGPADDPGAWHAHYEAHHAPLMAELPGIRELEVYAPIEWRNGGGRWKPVRSLQRNKVAFDSVQALEAALNSPVRAKMRADFAKLPAFAGEVSHYPMLSFDPWPKK
jgi:uncharacterized protein (TIGR02118 family)